MNSIISQNKEFINTLCQSHKVVELYAFGSVLREDFNENSDLDFLVSFGEIELLQYSDNYFDMKFSLEDKFNRNVDLIELKAIKNPIFKQVIERERFLVYERKNS